jgi:hypothetical protein
MEYTSMKTKLLITATLLSLSIPSAQASFEMEFDGKGTTTEVIANQPATSPQVEQKVMEPAFTPAQRSPARIHSGKKLEQFPWIIAERKPAPSQTSQVKPQGKISSTNLEILKIMGLTPAEFNRAVGIDLYAANDAKGDNTSLAGSQDGSPADAVSKQDLKMSPQLTSGD